MKLKLVLLLAYIICYSLGAQNEFIFGDALPDAPALAARGNYTVGVRTLEIVNENQLDILNSTTEKEAFYNRDLKIEIWYPAALAEGQEEIVIYDQVMGQFGVEDRPIVPFTFKGRAARDASIVEDENFPLVVVSHGYTGSRLLMTYLTENLASKGYVVAAIDHKESTFTDAAGFHSTLLNRSKDILFTVDKLITHSEENGHFLYQRIQNDNVGIIGYSMGGYGVLNVAGAGYSEAANTFFKQMTGGNDAFESVMDGSTSYLQTFDSRIKAVVAFAPWGKNVGAWDSTGLSHLKIPTFLIAGDMDDISGYENGIKSIYEGISGTEAYLLTYKNARHNVAPNPPAPETLAKGLHFDEYYRYAEPSWDERRINNINQHFITAFLGSKLKAEDHSKYLNVPEQSNDQNWEGFLPRTSTGMEILHKNSQE